MSNKNFIINISYVYIKGKINVNETRTENAENRRTIGSWLDGIGNAISHGKRGISWEIMQPH